MEKYLAYYVVFLGLSIVFVLLTTTQKESKKRKIFFQSYRYEYPSIIGSLVSLLVILGLYVFHSTNSWGFKLLLLGFIVLIVFSRSEVND